MRVPGQDLRAIESRKLKTLSPHVKLCGKRGRGLTLKIQHASRLCEVIHVKMLMPLKSLRTQRV